MLPSNTIDHLVIWVHPEFDFLDDTELTTCEQFVKGLATQPRVGLIEVPFYARPMLWTKLCPQRSGETYRAFLRRLVALEAYAKTALGERFLQWDLPGLVDGDEPTHVAALTEIFHVSPRSFRSVHGFSYEPKLFRSIDCFGQHPDSCVAVQARESHLSKISVDSTGYRHLPPFMDVERRYAVRN